MLICQPNRIAPVGAPPTARQSFTPLAARPLAPGAQVEVLDFLALSPVHNVALVSAIRDHGLVSPQHRGRFYCVRDEAGQLEGVALIGHATLVAAETDRALAAFARVARHTPRTHLIMGEREQVARFWQHFDADGTVEPRLAAREMLFTLGVAPPAVGQATALRQADPGDLDLVVPVQAELALADSGVNPLETDPHGFRARCALRVAQGRTWAVVEQGRLLFKAELQAVTPAAIYLEGIYVHPSVRGQGFGARNLSQLCRTLLTRTDTLCLLVNEQHHAAQQLYRKVGFRAEVCYDTIFLAHDC